jgi:hypothetical protein
MIRGSCLCGAVRFEIERASGPFELCHCNRCRKSSGSGYLAGIGVRMADFRFVQGQEHITVFELPVQEHAPGYQRPFCRFCGSPTPMPNLHGKWTEIPAGLLDDDPEIRPDRHIFSEHRAAWTPRGDGLPELDKQALIALRTRATKIQT